MDSEEKRQRKFAYSPILEVFLLPKLFLIRMRSTGNNINGRIRKISEIDMLTTTVKASAEGDPNDHEANEIAKSNATKQETMGLIGRWLLFMVAKR